MRIQLLSAFVATAAFGIGTLLAFACGMTHAEDLASLVIAKQGYFFVGGKYIDTPSGQVMAGQAYIEYQVPRNRTHPFPIVMIEGCCTSGAGFSGTVDGRDGWAQYFLAQGYAVYIMDQVGRGRSPYVESVYGEKNPKAPKFVEREFIAVERYNLFPQAHLHTQWPGTGAVGDPIFDQFQASMLPDFKDRLLREPLNRDAGVALLDKIGPAIILPHSQSGPYAWLMADARPELVKGLLMVEATGPPYYDIEFTGAPDYFKYAGFTKPFGLTRTPLLFSPPAATSGLDIVEQDKADGPDVARCWMQKEPARKLVNFKHIPILILSAEASFEFPTAHCSKIFLDQAGVGHDFVQLADLGIHGNGHFLMHEKNNLEIAGVIADWLRKNVTPTETAQRTVR
jgi:pimeloyl-ACP methyl ester carboxylesterase